MRVLVAIALICATVRSADAADRPAPACLSPVDAYDAVDSHQAVAPAAAVTSARRAVPGGEVLRAILCREADALVYHVTVLDRSGRVVRVTLDAASGKVDHLR